MKAAALICLCALSSQFAPAYAAVPPNAVELTGNWLSGSCNTKDSAQQDASWGICVTIVNSFVEGINAGTAWVAYKRKHASVVTYTGLHPSDGLKFCLPEEATANQVALVVTKYLDDHPEYLDRPYWALIINALQGAWPCGK